MGPGEDRCSQMFQPSVEICKIGGAALQPPSSLLLLQRLVVRRNQARLHGRPPGISRGGGKNLSPPPLRLCLLLRGEPNKSKGTCLYLAKILYL